MDGENHTVDGHLSNGPVIRETRLTHRPEGCRAHFLKLNATGTISVQNKNLFRYGNLRALLNHHESRDERKVWDRTNEPLKIAVARGIDIDEVNPRIGKRVIHQSDPETPYGHAVMYVHNSPSRHISIKCEFR